MMADRTKVEVHGRAQFGTLSVKLEPGTLIYLNPTTGSTKVYAEPISRIEEASVITTLRDSPEQRILKISIKEVS